MMPSKIVTNAWYSLCAPTVKVGFVIDARSILSIIIWAWQFRGKSVDFKGPSTRKYHPSSTYAKFCEKLSFLTP